MRTRFGIRKIWLLAITSLLAGCAGIPIGNGGCDVCSLPSHPILFARGNSIWYEDCNSSCRESIACDDSSACVDSSHQYVRMIRQPLITGDRLRNVRCRLAACKVTCHEKCLIAVRPSAIPYKPPMPPELLPVPVRPVFSPVNPDTPVPARGAVERDFGPQFTVAGRD